MRSVPRLAVAAASLAASSTLLLHAAHSPGSDAAEIQLQLANVLYNEARYGEALDAYDRATLSENPEGAISARMGIVRSALRVANFERARLAADALFKSRPQSGEIRALYGDSLWASGSFERAEDVFRDALALEPDLPRAHHGYARSLAARNQLEAALDEAQSALRLAPRDPEIHHTVGAIYERMHRFEQAATAFGTYVNLLPNKELSEKAAWSRAEIRFLRSFGERQPFEIAGEQAAVLHTLPFKLVNDKVVVRAKINGQSDIDFVLDTGSEQTVISRRTAQRAGVAPIVYTLSAGVGEVGLRGLQLGRLDSFEVGTLHIRNVPCLIKNPPLRGLPTREAESFSPLALGLSMTIDYGRRLLTIGRIVPREEVDFELPLRLYRLAMVRGTLDGQLSANFVVDTGGEVISISTDTASALGRNGGQRRIPLKVYGTSGWDRDAFLLPGVNLAFQDIEFRNFPVVVLNLRAPSVLLGFQLGGIVGHKFLSKYRVGIDLERSTVRLKLLAPARLTGGR